MTLVETIYNKYFEPGKVCTDSRKTKSGDLFIALHGENFDGNLFAEQALKQGALVAIIDNEKFASIANTILVENTLSFLQKLANHHRNLLGISVIGITGTNGKTTTKELIYNILSQKFNCQATKGNLNNHIGVPLTLLNITKETEIAVVEMGANHCGEIKELCEIAHPNMGLITNIGSAHLEGFGDFEGVKKTKNELYIALKQNEGVIYVNAQDKILMELVGNYNKIITYNSIIGQCKGTITQSAPFLNFELEHGKEKININTRLFGDYNLENILASTAIGLYFGLSLQEIKSGIEDYEPTNNRSQYISINTTHLILDCYNANPSSMLKAILGFSKLKTDNKIVVLGGMKELGDFTTSEHLKIIKQLKELEFSNVILVGAEFLPFKYDGFQWFENIEILKTKMSKNQFFDATLLVKGSRAYKLEGILDIFNINNEAN